MVRYDLIQKGRGKLAKADASPGEESHGYVDSQFPLDEKLKFHSHQGVQAVAGERVFRFNSKSGNLKDACEPLPNQGLHQAELFFRIRFANLEQDFTLFARLTVSSRDKRLLTHDL